MRQLIAMKGGRKTERGEWQTAHSLAYALRFGSTGGGCGIDLRQTRAANLIRFGSHLWRKCAHN